jgi:hypothetical protein
MKTKSVMAAALAVVGAVVGCSSTNGAGGGPYDSCLGSLLGSACTSCLQSHCGGALGSFQSGCGDYLGCICPGGDFSAPNAQSETCTSKLAESSCVSTQGDAGVTACAACQSACGSSVGASSGGDNFGTSSSSGGANGNGTGSSSGSTGSSNCGLAFSPGPSAVTLSLTGVDFGDATSTEWMGIGFNLDGLCTTEASRNTCTLATGAPWSEQDDGANGIDNSYGRNICAIMDTTAGSGACSTKIAQAFLQTDASGNGTLVVGSMVYPARDVLISMNGSAGMAGGVLPTAGIATALQNAAACISTSLCNASALQSILMPIEQASDIMADGSNSTGEACDGVSFGITFTGSTPVTSLPSPQSCPCP